LAGICGTEATDKTLAKCADITHLSSLACYSHCVRVRACACVCVRVRRSRSLNV
jgi:hypothetical protein